MITYQLNFITTPKFNSVSSPTNKWQINWGLFKFKRLCAYFISSIIFFKKYVPNFFLQLRKHYTIIIFLTFVEKEIGVFCFV